MAADDLRQLREIRDKIRALDLERADLVDGRNRLIRVALKADFSERKIAGAAGVHRSRVNQLKTAKRKSG